jgi:cation transporter-like permease
MRTAMIAAIVAMLVSATSVTAAYVVTSANIKNGHDPDRRPGSPRPPHP